MSDEVSSRKYMAIVIGPYPTALDMRSIRCDLFSLTREQMTGQFSQLVLRTFYK